MAWKGAGRLFGGCHSEARLLGHTSHDSTELIVDASWVLLGYVLWIEQILRACVIGLSSKYLHRQAKPF